MTTDNNKKLEGVEMLSFIAARFPDSDEAKQYAAINANDWLKTRFEQTGQLTLSHCISYNIPLTTRQKNLLVKLLGERCRSTTKEALYRRLAYPESIKNYGILDRVAILPHVEYCAGQDYPAEIATVRKIIISE
jgi:hypothetical protein